MTAINANVSDAQEWLPLTDADSRSLADGYYTIDSENVKVENGPHPATSLSISPYNGRRAVRGIGGTTAATHLSGASLTRYYPDAASAEGGSPLLVNNLVDAPEEVTTLIAPGAMVGGGEATVVTFPPGWSFDVDGHLVVDTAVAPVTASVRFTSGVDPDIAVQTELYLGGINVANEAGQSIFVADALGIDSDFTAVDGQIDFHLKEEDGANDRHYRLVMGAARTQLSYTDPDAASPDNAITLNEAGVWIGTVGGILVGFYGTTPVARPEVPATPTEQDIVDALVLLGLVTQAV